MCYYVFNILFINSVFQYLICEVLNFMADILNLYITDVFLGGRFMRYGTQVIYYYSHSPSLRHNIYIRTVSSRHLCRTSLKQFMGSQGRVTCFIHLISVQTSQEGIKCTKAKRVPNSDEPEPSWFEPQLELKDFQLGLARLVTFFTSAQN